MTEIRNQIRTWAASELKYWEQAALEMLVKHDNLQDEDYHKLIGYFKEDADLMPTSTPRPELSFPNPDIAGARAARCRLERIFNLKDVNALAPGQEMHFGSQLTLVYGNNGVGKTGYTRPLGCVGYARGEREVLPDATKSGTPGRPSAEIEVSFGDVKETIQWKMGDQPAELSKFCVFDENSAIIHLTRSNPLGFAPAGLSLLTRLATVTDEVRQMIRTLATEYDRPHDLERLFEGSSEIKTLVTNLGAESNLEEIDSLSVLTAEETIRASELAAQIAESKQQDFTRLLENKKAQKKDLETLLHAVEEARVSVDDQCEAETLRLITEVGTCRKAVADTGTAHFLFEAFTQVGKPVWLNFVSSAKALAESERPAADYPDPGDPCLLCRQPLPLDAVNLIRALWDFLASDPQSRLDAAESACTMKIQELEKTPMDYFRPDSGVRRLLEDRLPVVIPSVEAQVESCRARRDEIIESLRSCKAQTVSPLLSLDTTDLTALLSVASNEIAELMNSDFQQRVANAELELRTFNHRMVLGEKLEDVRTFIERKQWAQRALQSLDTTRAITSKYNEFFDRLVTKRYLSFFQETLQRFKRELSVTVETRGSKGETIRQIILSPKTYMQQQYSVDQVLSDGEKRAVAICDFLAEAILDESKEGIILDDPTTFFDGKWKCTLAECLVELARERQVIIFTHDLTFLYRLKEHSETLAVEVETHWIRAESGRPGFVYLNNSPVCEKDFRKAALAREQYSKSKTAKPEDEQLCLQQGFGALRASYEALIIFDLFNEVVARFDERISFGRLSDVCIDRALIDDIIARMEFLSGHIVAHLHSDNFGSEKPTPADLLREIEAFDAIRGRLKELQKAQKPK